MKQYLFLNILCVLFFSSLSFAMQQNNNENFFKNEDHMQSLINEINPGQTWRHYTNKDYRIIAISRNTLTWYVAYEALYDNEGSGIWHRPLDMFLETIEVDGEMVSRFKRVE